MQGASSRPNPHLLRFRAHALTFMHMIATALVIRFRGSEDVDNIVLTGQQRDIQSREN